MLIKTEMCQEKLTGSLKELEIFFFLYIVGKEWEHPGSIFWNSVRLNEKRNYKHSDQVTGMKLPTVN